jgi:hypothetical protein
VIICHLRLRVAQLTVYVLTGYSFRTDRRSRPLPVFFTSDWLGRSREADRCGIPRSLAGTALAA